MEVGRLNKVAVFKQNTPSAKGAGNANSYSDILTTRCSLKKQSGSRGLNFGMLEENSSYEMITRYQQEIEDNVRMDMKISIDGRLFSIQSKEKVGEKRFYYRFILNEVSK